MEYAHSVAYRCPVMQGENFGWWFNKLKNNEFMEKAKEIIETGEGYSKNGVDKTLLENLAIELSQMILRSE
jgi:hypothetical protein